MVNIKIILAVVLFTVLGNKAGLARSLFSMQNVGYIATDGTTT
jgi:hypothetical protein